MKKTAIARAIEGENKMLIFKPNRKFYESVGINSKRWGMLYRGDLEPTQSEIQALSEYFDIPVTSFFNQKSPKATTNC
jgi:hypothetical protein